jgi:translocation and assembly module TamB
VIRRILRWLLATIVIALILSTGSVAMIVATESGTRWLLARVTPYLPTELQISGVSGTLLGGLYADQIRWSDDSTRVTAGEAETQFELLPILQRQVIINTLHVERVDVVVTDRQQSAANDEPFSVDLPLSISIDSASVRNVDISIGETQQLIDRLDFSGQLSGSDLDVARFTLQSSLGKLEIAGALQLTEKLAANLRASWLLTMPEVPQFAGELTVSGDISDYQIQHVLDQPQQIESRGSIALRDDSIWAGIVNEWQLLDVTLSDGRRIQSADGSLHLEGSVDQFFFDGSTVARIDNFPELRIQLRGDGHPRGARFSEFTLEGERGSVMASGDFSIDFDQAVEVRIDSISGSVGGYVVEGSMAASYRESEFRLMDAHARLGNNEVDASGVFGEDVSLTASLRLGALSELYPDVAGSLNGSVQLGRRGESYAIVGKLAGSSIAWSDYTVESLTTRVDISSTESSSVSLLLEDVLVNGMPIETATVNAGGTVGAHDVRTDIRALGGQLNLEATGAYVEPGWSGTIESLSVSGALFGEWLLQQPADLSMAPSIAQIGRACLVQSNSDARGCVSASHDASASTIFDLDIDAYPIASLPLELPEGADVSGTVNVRADGDFQGKLLTGSASVALQEFGISATYEGDEISMDFEKAVVRGSIAENRLDADLQLDSVDGTATAAAQVTVTDIFNEQTPIGGGGSLKFTGLSVVAFLYPGVSNPKGKIGGSFELSGSLAAPEFAGEIALEDGSFDVRQAGITLSDIQLRLRQLETGSLTLDGSAVSGEGRLAISGLTTLAPGTGIRTSIDIDGQDFVLVQLPDWLVTASPSISVLLDDDATRVSGELVIPVANITVRNLPATSERASPDVVVRRSEQPSEKARRILSVDVSTRLGDDVELSGFGLTTGLEGSIRIQGGSNRPYVGNGRLSLRDGRYKAYGQDLEIERGELIFNGPLSSPGLDIRARRRLSDVVAGVHLTGTPTDLQSDVYSDPVMSDAEALSYLLTGRPLDRATATDGDLLNDAAFSLGLAAAGGVASQIGTGLGLDTLAVSGGASDGQLVAGKRLNDRIQVEYAYGIIDKLGTLVVRYDLTSRLLLETRSGTTHTLDLIYKVKRR